MAGKKTVTRNELSETFHKSNGIISKRLNKLIERKIVIIDGNKFDPNHTYSVDLDRIQGLAR